MARALKDAKGQSILRRIVSIYLDEEAGRLECLGKLVRARQAEELAQEAHSFGGNAVSFGGMQVRRVALELEDAARTEDWPLAEKRLLQLREASLRLKSELSQLSYV